MECLTVREWKHCVERMKEEHEVQRHQYEVSADGHKRAEWQNSVFQLDKGTEALAQKCFA